ncbi:hypothetical protein B7P43_G16587 [Cryptotermes secundus]|uniref:Peptide deformylase n=1 Tax=Cryptotermes secundus TaxID=105785 RepID=A0A2J7RJ01_9NEOP|nr:hypothetical protein B7P43_G16587 [Cryptotermes secundus]
MWVVLPSKLRNVLTIWMSFKFAGPDFSHLQSPGVMLWGLIKRFLGLGPGIRVQGMMLLTIGKNIRGFALIGGWVFSKKSHKKKGARDYCILTVGVIHKLSLNMGVQSGRFSIRVKARIVGDIVMGLCHLTCSLFNNVMIFWKVFCQGCLKMWFFSCELLKKMRSVMHSYGSFGLAAPQVGVPLSIFIVEFSEKIYEEFSPEIRKSREMAIIPFKVFINPELKITNYEKVCFPEACESVRGFSADVPRYREVLVTGLSAEGKPVSWQVSGWAARIVQHEMDHLSGRLYTDIMVRSTFTCTCWDKVNRTGGRIYVPFSPK